LPKSFYNLPESDPLAQSLDIHSDYLEIKKDTMGNAWGTGTGVLIRTSALEAIGGWPVESICEDVFCTYLLQGKGYKTVYVHENLQHGLCPESIVGRKIKSLFFEVFSNRRRHQTTKSM
jgi:cellulose synthase/poly-beta-1,6-N-acetylglucosamine synthase-like glycosyltransferase